jgi:hypothetical protein
MINYFFILSVCSRFFQILQNFSRRENAKFSLQSCEAPRKFHERFFKLVANPKRQREGNRRSVPADVGD